MMEEEYKSKKSRSTFIAKGTKDRAWLAAEGEAALNFKVRRQCEKVRRGSYNFSTVAFMARQLANTF